MEYSEFIIKSKHVFFVFVSIKCLIHFEISPELYACGVFSSLLYDLQLINDYKYLMCVYLCLIGLIHYYPGAVVLEESWSYRDICS